MKSDIDDHDQDIAAAYDARVLLKWWRMGTHTGTFDFLIGIVCTALEHLGYEKSMAQYTKGTDKVRDWYFCGILGLFVSFILIYPIGFYMVLY